MELTTFGALLRFGIELEGRAAELYRDWARAARGDKTKSVLEELARAAERHRQRLERERRENISEMLLEPVHEMRADGYRLELRPSAEGRDAELLELAQRAEEVLEQFYRDAAARLSVPEVARGLLKLAERHGSHRVELRKLEPTR
ncbi:MAG: ferritin family protein [Candidatus Acetothermia bacterium]|jgi:rubrerythrin|nr:ferritin family protein [Candidatus Acetothermia bacterium]